MSESQTHLWDSFYLLLVFNNILGYATLEMSSGRLWMLLSYVPPIVRSLIFGSVICYFKSSVDYHAKYFLIMVFMHTNYVIMIILTLFGIRSFKNFKRTCQKITLIDKTLEMFGIDPEYSFDYKQTKRIIGLWSLSSLSLIVSVMYVSSCSLKNMLTAAGKVTALDMLSLLNCTVELTFAIIISTLGRRFERINALILNLSTTSIESMNYQNVKKYFKILEKSKNRIMVQPNYYYKNRNNTQLVLKTARQAHLELCEVSRDVNKNYNIQLVLQMAATFTTMTGWAYNFYYILTFGYFKGINEKLILAGLFLLSNMIKMVYVVNACVTVSQEAQRSGLLCHEISLSQLKKNLNHEIQQFSLQIMQHPLNFTASGLISLDFSFVRGFLRALTTYLMIVIQNDPAAQN